jgi:hypothetical protein
MKNVISLMQLKANLQSEEDKRQALIDQGRRAYKLGIEEVNCPLKELSERKLWSLGWTKARNEFLELLRRNGGNMR